jgi:glycosyltransferase involved in cell wall biosynthesis
MDPEIEFVLAGWDVSGYQIAFPYSSAGVLPPNELAALYSQCDVALVLSFTNLSLVPLEVMACRCAVVSNGGANVEWLLDGRVARLADSNPESLSDAIVSLFEDADSLESLKQEGLAYAQSTSWDEELKKISMAIQSDF